MRHVKVLSRRMPMAADMVCDVCVALKAKYLGCADAARERCESKNACDAAD